MPRKVLIAEDNIINRQLLKNILRGEYEVAEASDGAEALSILNGDRESISAVLLDLMMPVMDGLEVLQRMRGDDALAQIPVIVATGSSEEESEVKALSMGANDFVTKPYNPALILHCLRNAINLRETASLVKALQRDKLTGLYSRETFFDKAREMIDGREPGYYVMSCFDINNFKLINDQYGAAEGDRLLRLVGKAAQKDIAAIEGIVGRISADNFAALYPVCNMKDFISEMQRERRDIADLQATASFSVGRYIVADKSLPAIAIYDRAYIAKQSVKGRYDAHIAYFNETMLERLIREQQIKSEMSAALANHQFEVWFQPQYNHSSGALIGAEALVRWRHPQKGLVPPGQFIPVFERNGFIYELDKYVWERACRYLREWADAGLSPLPVSVNISRYDALRSDMIDVIVGLVKKYGIPAEQLRLEITESAFAKSSEQIIEVAKRLMERGFTLEIDDFGSGYSSLNTLKDVPADVLKLDMRFLESDENSQRGGNILESIVRMAKWLGMSVIAEGVETREQADFLKSIGCNYVQGYLYAKPMPAEDYEAIIACSDKENRLLTLETVANLDNNAFWDPKSVDTLIFNSYIGAACIYEYNAGKLELLRANDKYAQVIGNADMTVEMAIKLNLADYLDDVDRAKVMAALRRSRETGNEVSGEFVFLNLPGCPRETYLRSTMRVIASTGERLLVYCTHENITSQRQAELRERMASERAQAIMDDAGSGITAGLIKDGDVEFLFSNDRYYEILGFTRAQYNAEVPSIFDLINADDRERVRQIATDAHLRETSALAEYRVMRRDGAERWVRAVISSTRFTGVDEPVQLCLFSDITSEKEAERAIRETDEQLKFLNETAHALLAQPDSEVGIANTLGQLLSYFGGGRAYVFEFDFELETASNTYEVCAEGVGSEKANLQRVPLNVMRFWLRAFDRHSYIDIENVDDLDVSRADEKAMLAAQGIKSLVSVPLKRDGALIGFIGIDNPTQQHSRIERLVALGDYIAVMLTRRDLTAKIDSDRKTLSSLMNDTPGGFVRMRILADGTNVPEYFNEGMCALMGMSRDELCALYGGEVADGTHPDDAYIVRETVEAMLARGEAHSPKYRLRRKDGSYAWVMIFGRMTKGEDGDTFLNIYYTDASELNRLEEQRIALLDNLPCGAGICEVSNGSARITYLNKRYRAYLKRGVDESFTSSVFDVVHPDDRDKLREAMLPAFDKGGERSCDIRIMDGSGGYIPFRLVGSAMEYTGGKNAIYVTFSPISGEELSYREMLPVALSAMMRSAADLAFVKGRDLRYVCCSLPTAKLAGLASERDIAGKSDYDLFDKALADKYADDDKRLIASGASIIHNIDEIRASDGLVHYVDMSKYPLHDSFGNVIGLYGVGRDITETRAAASRLELLTNSIPGGIATYSCSPAGISILYFNDGFCKLFGFTRDEYAENGAPNPLLMVFEEDRAELRRQLDALVKDSAPIDCVYRAHVGGGGYKWINHKAVAAERHAGSVTVNSVLFDVTERQEAAERIRISEEEHRFAMQHSGNIICRYNVAGRTASLTPDIAAAFAIPEKIYGVPYEPINSGAIAPESVEAYAGFFEGILRGEKAGSAVFQQKFTGDWRWTEARYSTIFSDSGAPVSAVISFYDVTERLEKEIVYKKWLQSLREKKPESYTLFRCNISKDAPLYSVEGSLLRADYSENALTFDEKTAEFARKHVFEADRAQYLALVNSDSLLAGYYRGRKSEKIEFREALASDVRWLRLSVELVGYPNSTDVEAYLMYETIDEDKRDAFLTIERAETDPLTGRGATL